MSINLYLVQLRPKVLDSLKTNEIILKTTIDGWLQDEIIHFHNSFRMFYASQGIFSVEDFIEKNPYIHTLEPELKIEALKRVKKIFRKNANQGIKVLSLDKSWHLIHFLLSGEVWSGESLLGSVLMGGTQIGDESFNTGYGVPRFHSPGEVKKIAENLPALETLEKNFDAEKIAEAEIYAFNADDADNEWDYLSRYYRQMFDYFQDAAKRGNGVLLFSA
jgi:hypothetical protein